MDEQLIQNVAQKVASSFRGQGLIQVEVSARHVHLSEEDVEKLFGKGATLTPVRELSQPGQFLCEERVTLCGPKSKIERTAILGPARKQTQVELSRSDSIALGVKAPLRHSGDVNGSGAITLIGPAGTLTLNEGALVARNHIHMIPESASQIGIEDNTEVSVEILSERPLIFPNVLVRVSPEFRDRMHLDFDEANAALVSGLTLGRIIKK